MARRRAAVGLAAGLLLAAGLTGGCLHSRVEPRWGEAYRAAMAGQTADPAAPASAEGPEGIDAGTAERVADRYYEGQEIQETRRARGVVIGPSR